MMTGGERDSFATNVIQTVRRWPGVELRPHASSTAPGEADGVEFRLFGRQIGHVHDDCSVHLSLTRALKTSIVEEQLAEPFELAPASRWATFRPMTATDAEHAIWLLRLNYVRIRRQRLTPVDAASSALLQEHEAALASVSPRVTGLLRQTRARSKPRPLPPLDA